jgi:hypothetical protein
MVNTMYWILYFQNKKLKVIANLIINRIIKKQ